MKKLIEMKTIEKDGHHMFTYENGIKTPIPDDGVVFCYLAPETEKGRMLKATDFPDRAGAIDGRFVVTDEVENGNGKPKINGVKYDVWGIGEDESGTYVIESARGNRFYIRGGEKKFVSHPNKGRKKEAMETIYEVYEMLV